MVEEQLVTFNLGNEEYAINIMQVQEIIRVPSITRVPKAPGYIEGIINLRGNVIPVLDLSKELGTSRFKESPNARIIIVQANGSIVGIRVDQVTEVTRLDVNSIEPPPALATNIESRYMRGVGKVEGRLVVLLGVDKIIERELNSYA